MAAPSLQTLQTTASQTGYQPATLEKVYRLLDLLTAIAEDAFLSPRLALKGGTALNVFHLKLDRLSVDIDLNYVGALDRETMIKERPQIEKALEALVTAQGYAIRRQAASYAGGKWIVRHVSALGGNGNLEIDLNYLYREPLIDAQRIDSVKLGEAQAKGVLVLHRQEIVAGKLVALLNRKAARDLFDARRIFEIEWRDWDAVRPAMLVIGAAQDRDWRTVTPANIGAERQELRAKLTMCLTTGYFVDRSAIDTWIAESAALCAERLAPLLDYTPGEKRFLDRLLDHGEVDVSGLTASPGLKARLERMPIIAWKRDKILKAQGG